MKVKYLFGVLGLVVSLSMNVQASYGLTGEQAQHTLFCTKRLCYGQDGSAIRNGCRGVENLPGDRLYTFKMDRGGGHFCDCPCTLDYMCYKPKPPGPVGAWGEKDEASEPEPEEIE